MSLVGFNDDVVITSFTKKRSEGSEARWFLVTSRSFSQDEDKSLGNSEDSHFVATKAIFNFIPD